jgi:hypothetical protein
VFDEWTKGPDVMVMRNVRRWRAAAALVAAAGCLLAAGCTPAPATPSTGATPSTPASSPSAGGSSSAPAAGALTLDITIAHNTVNPSGKKIDAEVGQQVIMNVTSDMDDEIHAHTGGDGYELEVPAGKTTTGTFTLTDPGSFEVESHHLSKVIVILNAR